MSSVWQIAIFAFFVFVVNANGSGVVPVEEEVAPEIDSPDYTNIDQVVREAKEALVREMAALPSLVTRAEAADQMGGVTHEAVLAQADTSVYVVLHMDNETSTTDTQRYGVAVKFEHGESLTPKTRMVAEVMRAMAWHEAVVGRHMQGGCIPIMLRTVDAFNESDYVLLQYTFCLGNTTCVSG